MTFLYAPARRAPCEHVTAPSHILPQPHPSSLAIEDLEKQCEFGRGRSSGPGGQHRNKVETLALVTHTPTAVKAHAGERRSAIQNKQMAISRLRLVLAVEVRAEVPAGDVRSEMWRQRTKGGRISCGERHHDFPAMLAEAMDMLWACRADPKKAAIRLEVTSSQLVRFLQKHPPAFVRFNAWRAAWGLGAMR
jgi:protein subunit release factor B